jgi:RNA polymerase sigma-70 factor (ECF subfamily)
VGCALAERFDSGIPMRMARESAEDAPSDPDAALVERICCGDGRAFETVVRRYQRPLYYLALRYVRNAFVRVHKSIRSFRGAASFRTWIYRIAINLSLNHLRDRKRERPSEIADDALTTSAVGINGLVADERRARLREAIDTLPPKQKLVIELRIYDELTFREVAELADCTENAAKVNFHHGMQRLRSLLAGDEP